MTCASCSRRVEKSLEKLDGVRASVNYATGVAFADVDPDVTNEELIAAIEKLATPHPSRVKPLSYTECASFESD
jgi:copper chaperone CopZ